MELPKIIKLWKYIKSVFGNDWSKKLEEIGAGFQELKNAGTSSQREKAARNLSRYFN